jgi:hypothetical protein
MSAGIITGWAAFNFEYFAVIFQDILNHTLNVPKINLFH